MKLSYHGWRQQTPVKTICSDICPLTLTCLFRQTRLVSAVFVWDLLRLVDGFHGFAASDDAAVDTFEDGGCFAALAAFGGG